MKSDAEYDAEIDALRVHAEHYRQQAIRAMRRIQAMRDAPPSRVLTPETVQTVVDVLEGRTLVPAVDVEQALSEVRSVYCDIIG